VVPVDEVHPAGLAGFDEQVRVRRAAHGVGQQHRPARAEVGVVVVQDLPVGRREVVGHAQVAARGQLEDRLAEVAEVPLDGEGESVGDRVGTGTQLEGERGGEVGDVHQALREDAARLAVGRGGEAGYRAGEARAAVGHQVGAAGEAPGVVDAGADAGRVGP